jgi:hypothetical protein
MNTPENGGPAFPTHWSDQIAGMDLRDWFAGQIAAGMAAFSGTAGVSYGPAEIAGRSYELADAMLRARRPNPSTSPGKES